MEELRKPIQTVTYVSEFQSEIRTSCVPYVIRVTPELSYSVSKLWYG